MNDKRTTLAGARPVALIDGPLLGDEAVAMLKRVGDARYAASGRAAADEPAAEWSVLLLNV